MQKIFKDSGINNNMCVLLVSNLKTSKAEIDIFGKEKLFTLRLIKKKLFINNIDFNFCEAKFFLKLHYSLEHTTLLWMIIIHTWDFHWLLLNEEDFGLQNLASLVLSDQSVAQCIFLCRHPCPLKTKREREGVLCTYYLLYKEATFSK